MWFRMGTMELVSWHIGWIEQAEDLLLDFLDGIADLDHASDGAWNVSHHIQEGTLSVDLHNLLVESSC